jgi:two-component system phosphate regulon sensor histidine kinase PhoR
VATFKPGIEEREGKMELELNAQSYQLEADETHLSNIVTNLIDNALKYCRQNPKIVISTSSNSREIELNIKDNGIGISAESQKLIFEKFYRVPTGNVHDVKGFGLGLHYVKLMVKEHGGSISVHSRINEGTTFTLLLPLKK